MELDLVEGKRTVQAGLWSAMNRDYAEFSGLTGLHRLVTWYNLGNVSLTLSFLFCFICRIEI